MIVYKLGCSNTQYSKSGVLQLPALKYIFFVYKLPGYHATSYRFSYHSVQNMYPRFYSRIRGYHHKAIE